MSVTKCKTIAVQDGVDALTSFVREVHCAGSCLQIKQLYVGDVGCVVWDAALVLAKFLENPIHFPPPSCESLGFWKGKRVIDIGAGTGIVGLAAGVLGCVSPFKFFYFIAFCLVIFFYQKLDKHNAELLSLSGWSDPICAILCYRTVATCMKFVIL